MPSRRRSSITSIRSARRLSLAYNAPDASQITILKEETNTGDHFLTPEQLENVYRTNVNIGLTDSFAAELLERFGPNELKELRGTSMWDLFRKNLFGWFQCVLWVAALTNFIGYFFANGKGNGDESEDAHTSKEYLYLGCVISGTIVGTGLFGFYQEAKNAAVMSGFEKLVPPSAVVIRDGVRKTVPNRDLVIGDIVEMSGGDIVPADVRILVCTNFHTDMSSLTGECEPIKHQPECTDSNPLESKNMAYFGCPITEGYAKAIVIATGESTQIGKIAGLVTGLKKEETPIAKEITHFIKLLCGVAFTFGIIFFFMVYFTQKSWLSALQYMLGIILANVPEGLIVTLTVCMTLSAKSLKRKNCLAKTLQAVETLGSTSCICSDKTGTLTENQMSVSHLFTDFKIIDKDDHSHVSDQSYTTLCLAASLNLKAIFTHDTMNEPVEKRKIMGDASESAILRYMEVNRSATSIREKNPKVAEIPFSSAYKYQVTIHNLHSGINYLIMKGAPEIVLEYCSNVHTNEGLQPLTAQLKKELRANFIKMANMGERVIGYCDVRLPLDIYPLGYRFDTSVRNFPVENLNFVGAISMIDPPRRDIDKYIGLCRTAGIKVVMVTGDHPVTALAISRKCGTITYPTAYDYAFEHHIDLADVPPHIKTQFKAAVVTGDELRKMSVNDLKYVQQRYAEITFARTSPQQKLFIVETYQSLGYVVAVTGDGVNDSPALKKADIGVAMGINGTEVSKKAADMILLDDNFASIVLGVQEGRRIFDNLKKTIAYTLTSNAAEMLPFVLYACLGMPLPLTLMLIIVINVGTDLLPAMSLAYEDTEEDIMLIPPRKLTDHLVNQVLLFMAYFQVGLIQFFAAMHAYFVIYAQEGFFPSSLMFVRKEWETSKELVKDTLGRDWNFQDRKRLERKAQTAYFVAVCLTQISDVIICKTRRISLLKKGMGNQVLNLSIVIDVIAAILVAYTPIGQELFGTESLSWYDFFLGVPFMLLMIAMDEFRRYLIRNNISKWVEAETYY